MGGGCSNARREHQEVESVGCDLTLEVRTDLAVSVAEKLPVENDEQCCSIKHHPKIKRIMRPIHKLFFK